MVKKYPTRINFAKMHSSGNDFVVIDAISQKFPNSKTERSKICKKIADRNFGVGCDQILIVEKSQNSNHDFFYRIYNADGSLSENCGNGARCFALFVDNHKLSPKKRLVLGIENGQLTVEQKTDSNKNKIYRVEMPAPNFVVSKIPYRPTNPVNKTDGTSKIQLSKKKYKISALSIGNPHAVIKVKDVAKTKVKKIGSKLQSHPAFPKSVNVSFMQIINKQNIRLRVFERGSGETLACGSGACAAVVAGIRQGLLAINKQIKVLLLGGAIKIIWSAKANDPIYMEGDAVEVFNAQINI